MIREHAFGQLGERGFEADALLGRDGCDRTNEPLRFGARERNAYRLVAERRQVRGDQLGDTSRHRAHRLEVDLEGRDP